MQMFTTHYVDPTNTQIVEAPVNRQGSVYDRIVAMTPMRSFVLDVGGGSGVLARRLKTERRCQVLVWDIDRDAIRNCLLSDISATYVDIEEQEDLVARFLEAAGNKTKVVVSTLVLEHLSVSGRAKLMTLGAAADHAFISIPNNCQGPDEVRDHTIKWTAMDFKRHLGFYAAGFRIECIDHYLLAIYGTQYQKPFTLSMCLPVRDEAADLEKTLASFRGVADQIVVGVDPRSKDRTEEIARAYADDVFMLVDPEGPPGDRVPDGGVHFAWVRNQCIERCTGEWVFMTEGHEHLLQGQDILLNLHLLVPEKATVGFVFREGNGCRWAFPWLFRPHLRFTRSTHNILDFDPDKTFCIKLPGVVTLHDRVHERTLERAKQRSVQNRKTLMEDWMSRQSEHSLFYLGSEWREYDPRRAEEWMRTYIATSHNGLAKYQARLMLAKILQTKAAALPPDQSKKCDALLRETRDVLMGAASDDWTRIEHWVWLGDLAHAQNQTEQALQFYLYASTRIENPPMSLWWYDICMYTYLVPQRLAMCYAELGQLPAALVWARRVLELFPPNTPEPMIEEARNNVKLIEEAIGNAETPE